MLVFLYKKKSIMLGIGTPYPLIHCLARPSPLPLHAPAPSLIPAFSSSTQQFLHVAASPSTTVFSSTAPPSDPPPSSSSTNAEEVARAMARLEAKEVLRKRLGGAAANGARRDSGAWECEA